MALLQEGGEAEEENPLGAAASFAHLLQAADGDETITTFSSSTSGGSGASRRRRRIRGGKKHIFQLFLGGPLSGAPFHLHGAAFNALVYGRKIWHLLPPSRDLYSSLHPLVFAMEGGVGSEWYPYRKDVGKGVGTNTTSRTSSAGAGAGAGVTMTVGPCEVVQGAGEVLYVPGRWSHSTLNLAESVGFAVEVAEG